MKVPAYFLKGMIVVLADPEPHPQDLLLPFVQGGKNFLGLVYQIGIDRRILGGEALFILDKILQSAILFLTDWGLKGNGLLRNS